MVEDKVSIVERGLDMLTHYEGKLPLLIFIPLCVGLSFGAILVVTNILWYFKLSILVEVLKTSLLHFC